MSPTPAFTYSLIRYLFVDIKSNLTEHEDDFHAAWCTDRFMGDPSKCRAGFQPALPTGDFAVKEMGDSFIVAFERAGDALAYFNGWADG
jgi:hypothetical protein